MRDLRIFRIFEGTNEILRLMIALQSFQTFGKCLKANKSMAVQAKLSTLPGIGCFASPGNAGNKLTAVSASELSAEAKLVEGE